MSDQPSSSKTHARCGHCKGMFPAEYAECPYCGASVESFGALGRMIESLLPNDRPMTKIMAGIALGAYVLIAAVAGWGYLIASSVYTGVHFGAMFPPYIIEGEYWRLVTAIFLHGDAMHIGFNIYALWVVGSLVEQSLGKNRFLLAFFISGVVSTVASMLWGLVAVDIATAIPIPFLFDPATAANFGTPSVGMSGAITGLIGVGVAAGHKVKNEQGTKVRNALLRWMGILVVFGLAVPGVDNAAHFGGFLAGIGLGYVLPLKSSAGRIGGWLYGGLSALCAAAIIASIVVQGANMPRDYPPEVEAYPQAMMFAVVREADPNAESYVAPWKACERAYGELLTPKADNAVIERAVTACDEARYVRPFNPSGYAWSAYAYFRAGDKDEACRRLYSGRLLLEQRYLKHAPPLERAKMSPMVRQFDLWEEESGCR